LENSDNEVDINKAWETVTENIRNSAMECLRYYELKMQKGCPKLSDKSKQAKL
jgi:hypothetical protein